MILIKQYIKIYWLFHQLQQAWVKLNHRILKSISAINLHVHEVPTVNFLFSMTSKSCNSLSLFFQCFSVILYSSNRNVSAPVSQTATINSFMTNNKSSSKSFTWQYLLILLQVDDYSGGRLENHSSICCTKQSEC